MTPTWNLRCATLGEIHNLDQLLSLYQGVGKGLAGIQERLERGAIPKTDESVVREKLDQLVF